MFHLPASAKVTKFDRVKEKIEYIDYEKKDCSGKVCYLELTFKDREKSKNFMLTAKLEQVDGAWKLVHFPGAIESIQKHQGKSI